MQARSQAGWRRHEGAKVEKPVPFLAAGDRAGRNRKELTHRTMVTLVILLAFACLGALLVVWDAEHRTNVPWFSKDDG